MLNCIPCTDDEVAEVPPGTRRVIMRSKGFVGVTEKTADISNTVFRCETIGAYETRKAQEAAAKAKAKAKTSTTSAAAAATSSVRRP